VRKLVKVARRILDQLLEAVRHVVDGLLNVPSVDPDDARRRKLLNFLLLCTVAFTFVQVWAAVTPLWSIPVILGGALVVYIINRYWSGQAAGVLFMLLFVLVSFASGLGNLEASHSLVALAIPIVMVSVLLHPCASFVMAGLLSAGMIVVGSGVYGVGLDVLLPAVLAFFLIALVSWIASHSAERALEDLRLVNRELDQRIARRTKDLERRSIQLQTASEVARDATATLDIERLLNDTVHLISERFGFYHASVFLIDDAKEYAVIRAASKSEGGQRMLARGHKLAVGEEGIVGHVAGTGEPLVVLDVGREAVNLVNPDLPDTRSEVALPLVGHGRTIGVLDVQTDQPVTFTKEDVATLQTMADQLANAIESAQLFTAEQQRRQEAETLYRAAQALVTTLDLPQVLEGILSELRQVVAYDSASVQLLRDGRLKIIGGYGFPDVDELLGVTFDLSKGDNPNGEVVRQRAPVIVDDAPSVYEGFRREPHAAIGIQSWLGVPLMLGDRLIGMLALDKREPGFYTPEHARLASAFAVQAAVAIENARLYEEAQRHVEELIALHSIDVAMISSLELDEVLSIIYEQISEALGVITFYIALCGKREDVIDARMVVEEGERKPPFTLKVKENGGFAARVIHTRQPLWVDDLEERDDLSVKAGIISRPMRSLMVLPLIVRDQVVGVISAQSAKPHVFDEKDQQLFFDIAHQVAIAITNIQLYQEVSRRLAEAELIQEVVMAAASTLDFDLVLERTIKALHRALGIGRLGFLLPDESGGSLVLHPSLVGFAESVPQIPIKGNLVGQVYRTGHPVLLQVVEAPLYPDQSSDVCSALAVPVRVGDRTAAVLLAESGQEGDFGEDEMRIFTTVAGQLGVALESARLYQEMAQYTRDLRLLAAASAGMIGSLEPQSIVSHLLDALVERFHSPCCIFLVEPDGEDVCTVAGWMPDGQHLLMPVGHQMRLADWSLFDHLTETQQLIYIPDVTQGEWRVRVGGVGYEVMSQKNVQSGLILPMFGQGGLVGAVTLGFYEPLPSPVNDQLDWAQALVNQAAAAVANAQLYQMLDRQATELAQAYNELQEIDRLRAQLIQNVSHELRTPLSLIKGYVELLIEGDLGRILDSQRAALQVIRERTASLSRLIHNLTMLQSVPREALTMAPVSLVDVIQRVLAEFQKVAEESVVVFYEELLEDLPLALGDRERLELAFGHLVDNAIKFSPDGGVVALRAWTEEDKVCVSVADEGIGISPDSLGRIFERFYQVDGSTRRRFGGMGIGLALVWEIIEVHGGSVRVESEPGEGSTFTVVLPISSET
jgi:GAF domain-containing protein/anti-sigma regulatory factor (Ser/Thr protein kinase)